MPVSDKDIIEKMRGDAEKGFRLLMARYKEPIYWHIRRLIVSHDETQDVAQETFIRIFRSFDKNAEYRSFKGWIYRIATNEALRHIERRKENRCSLDQVFNLQGDTYMDYSDVEAVRLQKAILSLPPKQQLAFNLRYYDEMDYDEIAEIAESTAASVKANYHLAKERIINYMNSND